MVHLLDVILAVLVLLEAEDPKGAGRAECPRITVSLLDKAFAEGNSFSLSAVDSDDGALSGALP